MSAHVRIVGQAKRDTYIEQSFRRIPKERGIANPYSHKSCTPRKSRTRAQKEGMLVQLDASPFNWLEGRSGDETNIGSRTLKLTETAMVH